MLVYGLQARVFINCRIFYSIPFRDTNSFFDNMFYLNFNNMRNNDFFEITGGKKVQGLSIHEIGGKTVITAPQGTVYLNEFMTTLPAGILNKKETGCGATTVVLENEENVIIACPTRQLINNKVAQYPNERCPYKLFSVQKGVGQNHIEEYIKECQGKQPIKIMVTYDSFPRVYSIMNQLFIKCKIVVDEYQELLDAYIYRNAAIRNLLKELKNVPDVTYLSATPIPYKWRPSEIEGLPEYEIEWKNSMKIMPCRIKSKHPFALAVNIIRNHKLGHPFELNGHQVREYFFFVNSVTAIKSIIRTARLTPDEVKIICAKTEINKLKLGNFKCEDAKGLNKTFTFCTKTTFYGADFYSEAGLAIVVSDPFAKSTLLDISTDIVQIAGRIRTKENPLKDIILHIYNTGIVESKAEYEEKVNDRLEKAKMTIEAFKQLAPHLREAITGKIRVDDPEEFAFYNIENNEIEIDKLKIAHAQYKFETIDSIYSDGLSIRDAYLKAGYNVEDANYIEKNIKNNVFFGMGGNRFEEFYKKYASEREKCSIIKSDLVKEIEFQYVIVALAYNHLGNDMVEELKYDEAEIRKYVHLYLPETQAALKEELKITFKMGHRYSLKEIKYQLGACFQKLRIEVTAKASLLLPFFNVKRVKIPNQDKRIDGYEIVNRLFFMLGYKQKSVDF